MPPRRTRRKIKIAPIEPPAASRPATETTSDVAISQQKRSPPPPPEERRRDNSGCLESRQPQRDAAAKSCPKVEGKQPRRVERKPRDNATSARANSSSSSNGGPIPQSIETKSPFLTALASSKRKAFDEYPSLFFTLRDFENVVSDTWSRRDPRNLHAEESSEARTLDDNDVCFRVTTTNLPFEKCLGKWRDPFDDGDFVRKFRVEGSTKENERTRDKRSSGCDVFDNNDPERRVGTKVRFVIESPNGSPSERDSGVKIGAPCDNSRSHESILSDERAGEQSAASSRKLTEIREESADVKDCCDSTRDRSYASGGKGNPATGEGGIPFTPAGASKVDARFKMIPPTYRDNSSNDVNCEKIREEGSDSTSWNVQASNEIPETGKESVVTGNTVASEQYNAKRVDPKNVSSEIAGNVRGFTDKGLKTACGIEDAAKVPRKGTCREEKVLLGKSGNGTRGKCIAKNEAVLFESSQNFLNVRNDGESNEYTGELVNKSVQQIEQTRRPAGENKERNNSFADSESNREIVPSLEGTFVKNVPVEVRRNSFLETMLSDDSADTSANCTVISTGIDKELNEPDESPNKILELKKGIAGNENSREFCKATELDTKNQEVLKDSGKVKGKIASAKSTQLANKSASDVKNDVLNELLCNFNNIKLKTASPANKKTVTKIEDDENTSRAIAIDNGISEGKENVSRFEKSRSDVRSVPLNIKTTDVSSNDTTIVEKIVKEDLTKTKLEEKPQALGNDIPAISLKVAKNKNIEIEKPNESFFGIKNKILQDNSEIKSGENSSDVKSKEINVETSGERMSEEAKNAIETDREPKKWRDVRVPKTILKKTSVERQQAGEFQKRIPIGAPATMNKIFDSKEFKAIASATPKNSLENGKRCKEASREIRTRGKEKTDEVIAGDKADDRRRIANRSALALVEDTMSSGDKCAIARKTISANPRNNNDNNRAVTPVANVSNDQSFRDVVMITPGKVRSFVKYYEIRGDTMIVERHSKINDRETVARRKFTKSQAAPIAARNSERPDVMTKGMKGGDRSVKSNDCDLPGTSSNQTQPSTLAPGIPEEPLNNPVCKPTEMVSKAKAYEKSGSHRSDKQTRASFTKTGAKKSVQFLGSFTVINSETFGEDESAGTVADDRDTNTLRKRRAPRVPSSRDCDDYQQFVREITKSEKPPSVEKYSLGSRKDVTQVSEAKF